MLPGASLSESINQADRSLCHGRRRRLVRTRARAHMHTRTVHTAASATQHMTAARKNRAERRTFNSDKAERLETSCNWEPCRSAAGLLISAVVALRCAATHPLEADSELNPTPSCFRCFPGKKRKSPKNTQVSGGPCSLLDPPVDVCNVCVCVRECVRE